MKNIILLTRLFIFLLLLFPFRILCQNTTNFEKELQEVDLKFSLPKHFTVSDSTEVFMPFSGFHLSQSTRKLISSKNDVVIYTTIIKYDTTGTSFIRRKINPNYDRKKNYEKLIKATVDPKDKVIKYFSVDTVTKLGATIAGLYSMRLEKPYKNRFKKSKVLFLTRENVADVQMVYFFNEGTDINKYINKTLFTFQFY